MAECVICCNTMDICAVYPCTHLTCHLCATRLVLLYKSKHCPLCKCGAGKPLLLQLSGLTELLRANRQSEALDAGKAGTAELYAGYPCYCEDGHMRYASLEAFRECESLLSMKCAKCGREYATADKLAEHVKIHHSLLLCDVCMQHGHQFWHEIHYYAPDKLNLHKRGKLPEPGFPGHSWCVHCRKYLYNAEEARQHCLLEHQMCTICDILGLKNQFYSNYPDLEKHYKAKHYCCKDPVCIRNMCYVYASKNELWSHCIMHHAMDIKLADIQTGLVANPPVNSLENEPGGGGESALFRQPVNLVTPVISEPNFPNFGQAAAQDGRPRAMPFYMDRSLPIAHARPSAVEVSRIAAHTKLFAKEIAEAINAFVRNESPLPDMVATIEACVDKKVCLRILETVPFSSKAGEVAEFLKAYRPSVIFPAFTKAESPPPPSRGAGGRKGRSIGGFKILDLSKK